MFSSLANWSALILMSILAWSIVRRPVSASEGLSMETKFFVDKEFQNKAVKNRKELWSLQVKDLRGNC